MAIAARLTEDKDVNVAVLEAGGNALDDVLVDAPNMFMQLWGKPQYDWDFKTVPQVRLYRFESIIFAHSCDRKVPRAEFMAGSAARYLVAVAL